MFPTSRLIERPKIKLLSLEEGNNQLKAENEFLKKLLVFKKDKTTNKVKYFLIIQELSTTYSISVQN